MPPKTRKPSATVGQQSLKASWTAVKTAKAAAGVKKTQPRPTVVVKEDVPTKETKKPAKKRKSLTSDESDVASEPESPIEEFEDEPVEVVQLASDIEEETPQLTEKKVIKKPSRSKVAKETVKGGTTAPIHTEGETKADAELRKFDLSYEYGPCVGFTRLERWNRADAMGLDPPKKVYKLLVTPDGTEVEEYKEPIYGTRV